MLKQTRQLFLVRFIVLLARILVIDTDFLSQIGKDNLWIIILLRIVTLIFTLMDAPLTTIAFRAELRRSVLLLSDDASSGAMLLQIRIDLFIAILLQPFVLFRWNRHITDQEGNSCILSGGQVLGLYIQCFVYKIPLQPYRRQHISLRDRRAVICLLLSFFLC